MDVSSLFSVRDRVALVTGGSSGIGRMIATGLAAAGAKVYICARSGDKIAAAATEIARETGGSVTGIRADLSDLDGIKALAADIASRESKLHILVNNAGTLCDAPIEEYPEDGWDSVLDLNLKATFFLMQKLLPELRAAGTAVQPASVINIGSVGALRVGPRETYAYAAAKAGLHHVTKSLAKRLGPDNITVNVIAPGFFPSEMTKITSEQMHQTLIAMVPRRRVGEPEDMAGAAIFLASRAGAYITGAVIPVEGGMSI
ncbi:MAG: 3-oxoacyl-ACP reductase FabG [Alphaproteobacteria bacterium]|nr:3-oxoacyl-ACP reductase FabG [Alphaproteobacteria bacterium]